MTIDGKVYGYPRALEAISLLYSKALLPDGAPATFQEMLEIDTKLQADGKHAILWAYETPISPTPCCPQAVVTLSRSGTTAATT